MIITISRQFGAGGSLVARQVADALGWRVVDNELIDAVARGAGLPPEEVARKEERAPGFLERLARALARSVPELFSGAGEKVPEPEEAQIVQATERVVADLAAAGRVVMVGRAGAAVLSKGGEHDALHVKLVAPLEFRLEVAMRRLGVGRDEAERVLRDTDASRERYVRQNYQRDWDDATNYHLVLNTGALGWDAAGELIVEAARGRWGPRLSAPAAPLPSRSPRSG
jgi:cytidylate kinase